MLQILSLWFGGYGTFAAEKECRAVAVNSEMGCAGNVPSWAFFTNAEWAFRGIEPSPALIMLLSVALWGSLGVGDEDEDSLLCLACPGSSSSLKKAGNSKMGNGWAVPWSHAHLPDRDNFPGIKHPIMRSILFLVNGALLKEMKPTNERYVFPSWISPRTLTMIVPPPKLMKNLLQRLSFYCINIRVLFLSWFILRHHGNQRHTPHQPSRSTLHQCSTMTDFPIFAGPYTLIQEFSCLIRW